MTAQINFATPPAIGTAIVYGKRRDVLVLADSAPCVRKDGSQGTILTWTARDGRKATSGLVAKAVTWVKP